MLHDSLVVAAVVRTRSRAIPLAMITMRKSWVSFCFPYVGCLWGSTWRPFRLPELHYHKVLQGITRYHTVSQGITQYHRVSQGITRYHTVSQDITRYHKVSLGITRYHKVSHGITKYH